MCMSEHHCVRVHISMHMNINSYTPVTIPSGFEAKMRLHQFRYLTHWGRVTHICVSKRTIVGSDNGLSPGRRQAIIWTNAGILLIRTLRTNSSEILIKIITFSFMKMRLKVSSAKRRPFCLGLNVLSNICVRSNCLWHDRIFQGQMSSSVIYWIMFWCANGRNPISGSIKTSRTERSN